MISRYFDIIKINYREIEAGMLLNFTYKGKDVHDRSPLIYVLEVRGDRVWGLNLKYKSSLLDEIATEKKKELKKLKETQEKEINKRKQEREKTKEKESSGFEEEETEKETIEEEEEEEEEVIEIPGELLETYNLKNKDQSQILRNYLPMYIGNLKKLVFKISNL